MRLCLYSATFAILYYFNCFFLEKISCIFVAGPCKDTIGVTAFEVLTGDLGIRQFPKMSARINLPSMVMHNRTILLCGGIGNEYECLQLYHGNWKKHSSLNSPRSRHSAVETQIATFIFGGISSPSTYEYLPKDSLVWMKGKTPIPGGFAYGSAIAVKSDQEIWLIGGSETNKRILSFNVSDHTFHELPFQLNVGRTGNRCAYIPNTNKIIITGGYHYGALNSTEILDIEKGCSTMASPMNSRRMHHGIGIITINGEDKLAVFGGDPGLNRMWLDSVELYNNKAEKWETTTTIKLNEVKVNFSFLTVKLRDIIDNKKEGFDCNNCHLTFTHFSNLKLHMRAFHSSNITVEKQKSKQLLMMCDICDTKFITKPGLENHVGKIHHKK